MKLKFMTLLAGVSTLAIIATPLVVKAAPTALPEQQVNRQVKGKPDMAALELTAEQKAQMAEVRRQTRSQIAAILTPEQREQFSAAMQERQQRRAAWAELNLSADQKSQLREIGKSAKSQMEAILTPEQRQQLQQMRQTRKLQPQQRN